MAFTSPKMGLSIWNLLTDPYDHAQLADNFSKIDLHDHTPGRGIQIPTEGLADGAVTAAKLVSSLDPSLGYATYKDIIRASGNLTGATANTYQIPINGAANVGTTTFSKAVAFYLNPADYAVSGRSTVLRITHAMTVNSVAPAITMTAGLYPIATYTGTSNEVTVATLGSVVSGSTAAIATPAAGPASVTPVLSSDFAFPSAGYYLFGVVASGAQAANSHVGIHLSLQVRQV